MSTPLPRSKRRVRYKRQVHCQGHALDPENPAGPAGSFALYRLLVRPYPPSPRFSRYIMSNFTNTSDELGA